jgi:hypothetical protein
MKPNFDAIERDILAGMPLEKVSKKYSRPVLGLDGKPVSSYGIISVEFLREMAERLKKRQEGAGPASE